MTADNKDDFITDDENNTFEDAVSQRVIAFVTLAQFTNDATDPTVKELSYTMMRKITATIKTHSTADVVMINGTKT